MSCLPFCSLFRFFPVPTGQFPDFFKIIQENAVNVAEFSLRFLDDMRIQESGLNQCSQRMHEVASNIADLESSSLENKSAYGSIQESVQKLSQGALQISSGSQEINKGAKKNRRTIGKSQTSDGKIYDLTNDP